MPFSTTQKGVREAILYAVKGLLVAKISDLDAALKNISPAVNTGSSVTAGQFYVGDFAILPDQTTNPWWVTICKGGRADGRDTEIGLLASGGIFEKTFWTNIYFYLHPDTFPTDTDAIAQAEKREVLRARFEDWLLDDVLCTFANLTVTLASQTYAPPADDTIDESYVRAVTDGYETKSFGGSQDVQTQHFLHQCVIRGAI